MVHRPTVAPGWPQDARNIKWNSSWGALATGRVEVYCPSIREPRPTRVRKPRPWRIPRAIQEDWAKNSRKATKRGAPYSKRVYGVASPDAPKKARKICYVRRPSINNLLLNSQLQSDFLSGSLGHSHHPREVASQQK